MQRGRGGRDDLFGGFGDPFAGFPGFGGAGSLISSLFGGREPFDDPFFTQPFGGMMGPSMLGPSMLGPSMFRPSMFSPWSSPFGLGETSNAVEQQALQPSNKPKGPIIKEITSDGEEEDEIRGNNGADEKKDNPRKHSRSSNGPRIQDPNEEVQEKRSRIVQHGSEFDTTERRSRIVQHGSEFDRTGRMPPQDQTYSFQSSTITYGGPSGAYYTASTTRRMGGDGVVMEESKEADSTNGKATHRVSRGIRDKGHSVTRKLKSDGRVDSLQTLHNLNEDELAGFDEAWKGKAREYLPGWNEGYDMLDNGGMANSRRDEQQQRGWALPSTGQPNRTSGNPKPRSNSFGGKGR